MSELAAERDQRWRHHCGLRCPSQMAETTAVQARANWGTIISSNSVLYCVRKKIHKKAVVLAHKVELCVLSVLLMMMWKTTFNIVHNVLHSCAMPCTTRYAYSYRCLSDNCQIKWCSQGWFGLSFHNHTRYSSDFTTADTFSLLDYADDVSFFHLIGFLYDRNISLAEKVSGAVL